MRKLSLILAILSLGPIGSVLGTQITFSVEQGSRGLPTTAVDNEAFAGTAPTDTVPGFNGGGVFSPAAGPAISGENESDLFRGGNSFSANWLAVDEFYLDLYATDDLDALSGPHITPLQPILFSMMPDALGQVGSGVWDQGLAGTDEVEGDVYITLTGSPDLGRTPGTNSLYLDESQLALQGDDNLDGLNAELLSEQSAHIYFSLNDSRSSTLAAGGFSGADVFVNAGGASSLFAAAATMGLGLPDDIDAMIMFDTGSLEGELDTGDVILFSLAPASPSLAAGGFSAADVFHSPFDGTFSLYATAESLGLMFEDDIDALDIIPEPATLALLLLGGLALLRRRRL